MIAAIYYILCIVLSLAGGYAAMIRDDAEIGLMFLITGMLSLIIAKLERVDNGRVQ